MEPLRAGIGCTQAHGLKPGHKCKDVELKIRPVLGSIQTGVTHGRPIVVSCTTAHPVIFRANRGTRKGDKFGGVTHNRSGLATTFLTSKSIPSLRITWGLSS